MPIELANVGTLRFSARYYYGLTASNGMTLTVLRDEAPPQITGGRGGWEVVPRRRRKGLTKWVGRDPLHMDVPVIFDGWTTVPPYSIESDKNTLMDMANGDNFVIPPTIKIEGNLPAQGVTWVIEDLTWGTNVIWDMDNEGNDILVRQDCVIHLLQYVEEDVVKILTTNPLPKTYNIVDGDTPRSVALKQLGDAALWVRIRDANPDKVRDPNHFDPSAKTIIMPQK